MSGRVTYRGGRHPSAAGGWVKRLRVNGATWNAAAAALGRELTAAERERIAGTLATHRSALAVARGGRVPRQDTNRTLAALARLPDSEIGAALSDADETTQSAVERELHRAGASTEATLLHPTAAALRAAIVAALANLTTKGGRPADAPRLFALAVLRLWGELDGPSDAIATWEGRPSALVEFAAALFAVVHPLSAERVRELLTEAREGFPP